MIPTYKWWLALITDWEARFDWLLERHGGKVGAAMIGAVLMVELAGLILIYINISKEGVLP